MCHATARSLAHRRARRRPTSSSHMGVRRACAQAQSNCVPLPGGPLSVSEETSGKEEEGAGDSSGALCAALHFRATPPSLGGALRPARPPARERSLCCESGRRHYVPRSGTGSPPELQEERDRRHNVTMTTPAFDHNVKATGLVHHGSAHTRLPQTTSELMRRHLCLFSGASDAILSRRLLFCVRACVHVRYASFASGDVSRAVSHAMCKPAKKARRSAPHSFAGACSGCDCRLHLRAQTALAVSASSCHRTWTSPAAPLVPARPLYTELHSRSAFRCCNQSCPCYLTKPIIVASWPARRARRHTKRSGVSTGLLRLPAMLANMRRCAICFTKGSRSEGPQRVVVHHRAGCSVVCACDPHDNILAA